MTRYYNLDYVVHPSVDDVMQVIDILDDEPKTCVCAMYNCVINIETGVITPQPLRFPSAELRKATPAEWQAAFNNSLSSPAHASIQD